LAGRIIAFTESETDERIDKAVSYPVAIIILYRDRSSPDVGNIQIPTGGIMTLIY
jgi:hypothetical protein